MNTFNLLNFSQKVLKDVSSEPLKESCWILSQILDVPMTNLYLKEHSELSKEDKDSFLDKIEQRSKGYPLQYLLGESYFMGEKFFIQPGVFIPRKESEVLVSCALNKNQKNLRGIDLGAGSGTLCLSFLQRQIESTFLAVEISQKSIECLEKNAKEKNLSSRLKILKKDVSLLNQEDVFKSLGGKAHLIFANPPYIAPHDAELEDQVSQFEPPLALYSDQGGFGHIQSWFEKAMELLDQKGYFIFEFGYNQSSQVQSFLNLQKELKEYKIYKDELGFDRAAICLKK